MYIVRVFRIGIVSIPWKVTCSNSRTTGVLYSRYTYRNIRGIRRKAGQLTIRSMIEKTAIYICNLISNEIFKFLHSIPFYPSSRASRELEQFLAYKSVWKTRVIENSRSIKKLTIGFLETKYSILCFLHSFFPPLPSLKRDNLGPDLDPSFFIYRPIHIQNPLSLSFSFSLCLKIHDRDYD